MRNGWLAFSLLAAACVGAATRPVIFPVAGAAAPAERCDWRFNFDRSAPNIPDAKGVGEMDENYVALSMAGYHYVGPGWFERCVPAQ